MACTNCICGSCLHSHKGDCPYGTCLDDWRAQNDPYTNHHQPRYLWSISHLPGEQEHWCRGGSFYPGIGCAHHVLYAGATVRECLKANVTEFQDGSVRCSIADSIGCQRCYEEFLERLEGET